MSYDSKKIYHFHSRKRVAVIGCGRRARDLLSALRELAMGTELCAVCDTQGEEVFAALREMGYQTDSIKLYQDADKMLDEEAPDGVILGTRVDAHVMYAEKVLARNIPLLIEKPLCMTMDELIVLRDAYERSEKKVLVSFPLRHSPMSEFVRDVVASGQLGTIEHAHAFNYVPYGGVYFHNWYRATGFGGMFFEKSTHDMDNLNYVLGLQPMAVFSMVSQQIFGGGKEPDQLCCDCEKQESCMESPFMQKNFVLDEPAGDWCGFSSAVTSHDSSDTLIRYESGMHASYTENLFARKGAAARGARLCGYHGTLDFDWCTNQVVVNMHHISRRDTYEFDAKAMAHFGGDKKLMYEFVHMMQGDEKILPTMEAGLISTLMCIAARESAKTGTLQPIAWADGKPVARAPR